MGEMMVLGDFVFSLNTAAFSEMNRDIKYKWASQDRFGTHEALQFLGVGEETITLPGTIITSFRGGTGQVSRMREMARKGEPQTLVDGRGSVLGRWVIEGVEEKASEFFSNGAPRKQEFTLKLRHYDGGDYKSALNLLSYFF